MEIIFLSLIILLLSCILLCLEISEPPAPSRDAVKKKTKAMLREMNRKTFEAQQEMIREALRSVES